MRMGGGWVDELGNGNVEGWRKLCMDMNLK